MSSVRLSRVQWEEAQRLFEVEGWTSDTIADYYGVKRATVAAKAAANGWAKSSRQSYTQAQLRQTERLKAIRANADNAVAVRVAAGVEARLDELVGQAREEAIVEANAQEVSRVMLLHRTGATRVRELVAALFSELQLISLKPADLEHLVHVVSAAIGQEEGDGDEKLQRRIEKQTVQAFRGLFGLDNRADIAKKLVDAMVKVVELERRVYGIRDEVSEGDVAKALKELAGSHD